MKRADYKLIAMAVWVALLYILFPVSVFSEESVTIVGTVNDDFTFVDDEGAIYLIAETEAGFQVAENSGIRIIITGTIEEGKNVPIIRVESYAILKDELN